MPGKLWHASCFSSEPVLQDEAGTDQRKVRDPVPGCDVGRREIKTKEKTKMRMFYIDPRVENGLWRAQKRTEAMMKDLLFGTPRRQERQVRGFRKDKEGNFFLHVEVPGLKAEDLDLEYQNDGVLLQGKTPEGEDTYQNQIRYFFLLPEEADPGKIQATLQDGVLTFRVAAKADAAAHKIPIA